MRVERGGQFARQLGEGFQLRFEQRVVFRQRIDQLSGRYGGEGRQVQVEFTLEGLVRDLDPLAYFALGFQPDEVGQYFAEYTAEFFYLSLEVILLLHRSVLKYENIWSILLTVNSPGIVVAGYRILPIFVPPQPIAMYNNLKVVAVLPAYNASRTLEQTYREIPFDLVDEVILCDDASKDNTSEIARLIGIEHVIVHPQNRGYGGNQKSLYRKALDIGADIVIMLHPDYQYTPKLIPAMVNIIGEGLYPVVLGSRILGNGALNGGMPLYKYVANRFLTLTQNLLVNHKLSEYHTGYRAFSREVLEGIDFENNSDDFVFDNEMLSQVIYAGFGIAEVTCPTKYFEEASSINFRRSTQYGFGVLRVSIGHFLQRLGLVKLDLYRQPVRKPNDASRERVKA